LSSSGRRRSPGRPATKGLPLGMELATFTRQAAFISKELRMASVGHSVGVFTMAGNTEPSQPQIENKSILYPSL
jgi:hypothetical protein